MSQQDFFGSLTIFVMTEFSFVATYFSSLVLIAGWAICYDRLDLAHLNS